ncbi:MAG TPA: hypothetical protein HA254_05480 [Candidatus Diapherotrites archaeon]|uniref:Uncharacterized protein n=1 Tax=Candidatus Iainarchaeum sp. TaxID=3101447 RepID=A0A7J4J0T7_9ARCH|nr:hypothetical protein [Candidatus Diapherotrites archaeon]
MPKQIIPPKDYLPQLREMIEENPRLAEERQTLIDEIAKGLQKRKNPQWRHHLQENAAIAADEILIDRLFHANSPDLGARMIARARIRHALLGLQAEEKMRRRTMNSRFAPLTYPEIAGGKIPRPRGRPRM